MPEGLLLEGVDDSKKLSEKRREQLYEIILSEAIAWSVSRVDAAVVDSINIKQAARLAMKQAVEALLVEPDYLLVDAEKVDCEHPQLAIIKGDARSQSIAAASIVAKVTRDRLCAEEWELYTLLMELLYIKDTQQSFIGRSCWNMDQVPCTGNLSLGSCLLNSRCCFNHHFGWDDG